MPTSGWSGIESADFREYVARLRSSGCPEAVVQGLVILEIHKPFNRQREEMFGYNRPWAYWQQSVGRTLTASDRAQLAAWWKTELAQVKALLGIEVGPFIARLLLWTDKRTEELAWLPAAKRDTAAQIFENADLRKTERATTDADARGELEHRLSLLKGLLSPAELEEYRLRTSKVAEDLRAETEYFELTPAEFKALFELRDAPRYELGARAATLRKVLGEERATAFELTTEWHYREARAVADRFGLGEEAALGVARLKREGYQAAARLGGDGSRPVAERREEWSALVQSSHQRLLELFGPEAAQFLKEARMWLSDELYVYR